MAEYIEREALLKEVYRIGNHPWSEWETAGVVSLVSKQPNIEAEPVKRGRWEVYFEGKYLLCSECKASFWDEECNGGTNYCPNCGAKMDGDPNE